MILKGMLLVFNLLISIINKNKPPNNHHIWSVIHHPSIYKRIQPLINDKHNLIKFSPTPTLIELEYVHLGIAADGL